MKNIFFVICLLISCSNFAKITIPPKSLVQYDLKSLTELKEALKNNSASEEAKKVYKSLIKKAEKLLAIDNPTVINKKLTPPTNSKNDYLSISRYWWPDETKKNGLPWIRKDGNTNPDTQTDAVDRKRLSRMSNAVSTLGLAYFLSGDERFAKKGTSVVKTWFLNEKTHMNPHLKFSQSVPGNPKSRRSGILDGREIPLKVLDGLTMMSNSKYWKDTDQQDWEQWLRDYMVWLAYSETGRDGAEQKNNHGSWYNFQLAAIAYYNGDINLVKKTVEKTKKLLDIQLNAEGGQEHELKRTRSFFYSCFNLDAITRVAIIAEKAGVPFWDYKSEDNNKGIVKALDFIIPVVEGAEWKYKTKKKDDISCMASLLVRVNSRIKNPKYEKALQTILESVASASKKSSRQKKIYRDHHLVNQGLF